MNNPSARYAACCDLGGTQVRIGLVDEEGRILARDRYLLCAPRQPDSIVDELAGRLRDLVAGAGLCWGQLAGLGYSTAGMMDVESGVIFCAPTQGPWRDAPFKALLQAALGLPAWIEMDANAAALGEAWKGAGADDFVYVVVGTGIGAGILLRGRVHRGWRGTAGELGHTTIEPNGPPCNCGNFGCLEALAAGPAIALRAQAALLQGRRTLIADLAGGEEITAGTVWAAARQGDGVALEIAQQTAEYLGIGLANVINLLNPKAIALGGGVFLRGADVLLDPIRRAVARRCGNWIDLEGTRIVPGALADDAGLLGAARLVWENMGHTDGR